MSGKRIRILPYRTRSRSAKSLALALGAKLIRLENSKYVPRDDDLIINWGNSRQTWDCNIFLNYTPFVEKVSNKLKFFSEFGSTGYLPDYWTYKEEIEEEYAYPIVCRTILNGHSGAGIVIANSPDELVDAPLYVKYEKKKDEYRVHVGRDRDGSTTVFSLQRKARRLDEESPDWQIRNHQNGFVYVRQDLVCPIAVEVAAREVFARTGLDFGAVDVIYNQHLDKAWVLEVNTAPGLEGTTIEDYKKFFLENYVEIP